MKSKQNVRCLALIVVLIALTLAAGTVFAVSEPDISSHEIGDLVRSGEQDIVRSPAEIPYDTLVDVSFAPVTTLDPHIAYDFVSVHVVNQVYETLLAHKREEPELIPQLATAWEVSPDSQVLTFTVRSGVNFHAGGTLEPHDVAYSFWRLLLQDNSNGPSWLLLQPLLGVSYIDELPGDDLEKCQAAKDAVTYDDGARTVTFHLPSAYSPFMELLASWLTSVLDQEWMAANGGWGGNCADWRPYHDQPVEDSILYDQMNGTGPFRFSYWSADEIELLRHNGYWRTEPAWEEGPAGPAALGTVLFKVVADWETRRDMLLSGEADIGSVPSTNLAEVEPYVWGVYEGEEDRDPTLLNTETGTLRLFKDLPGMSQTAMFPCYDIDPSTPYIGSGVLGEEGIPPDFFADEHVRKAFNYAMDWSTIIDDAYAGEGFRSRGPIPRGMLGYTDAQPVYDYNLELSAQEFEQAWEGQVVTQGFSMTLAYNEGNLTRQRITEVLAENLESISPLFHVNVISQPWLEFLNNMRSRRLPAFATGWIEDYHHPHDWVQPFLHSSGTYVIRMAFPQALTDIFDPKVEECLEIFDPAAAQTCYEELQNLSYLNAAVLLGVQPSARHYERTEVRGYYFQPAMPNYFYYNLSKGSPPLTAEVSDAVNTTATFTNTQGSTSTLEVPAGAVSEPSVVVYTPDIVVEEAQPGGFALAGITFDLQVCQDGECLSDYQFNEPVELTLYYSDAEVAGLIEEELYLYTWDGSAWVDAVLDCGWPLTAYERYPDENRLVVPLCHFTEFALVGDTNRIYLPLVMRNH
jgi:peptide/nickel transport system substrate-binding protein